MDFILNGQGHGSVAGNLIANGMDVRCLRPYLDHEGRSLISIVQNGKEVAVPVANATATLRKDAWIHLDTQIIKAAKERLRVWSDIRGAGLTYSVPNAMGRTSLEYERQSDINPAIISMDGLRQSQNDRPEFDLSSIPLPIIHKDFFFSARQLAASRDSGSPLDTTTAELAGRRVAEELEKLTLGVSSTYSFGGGTIYGLRNFTSRMTKVITSPEAGGWTPATLVNEVLEMKLQSHNAYHYGPWMIYHSPAWDPYMDDDYSAAKGDNTLRERLKKIAGIQDVRVADHLPDYDLIMVQMTSDVSRCVLGIDLVTVQWEVQGGMQVNYKVMCILVPQFRSDINGKTGIVHGAPA